MTEKHILGFTFSRQINYFSLVPRDKELADLYSKEHTLHLNGLIKPWLIIALLICLISTGLFLFEIPGSLFVAARSFLDIMMVIIWWLISKRSQKACLFLIPFIYCSHFAFVILNQVVISSDDFVYKEELQVMEMDLNIMIFVGFSIGICNSFLISLLFLNPIFIGASALQCWLSINEMETDDDAFRMKMLVSSIRILIVSLITMVVAYFFFLRKINSFIEEIRIKQ